MRYWQARVEWATSTPYADPAEIADQLVTRLEAHDAAVGPESLPSTDPQGRAYWCAILTVQAGTVRQAIATALELVEGATGEKATAVEVLPDDVADARALAPSIPELAGYVEIADMFGVSNQRARQIVELDRFPVPVVKTATGPLWVRAQVESWGKGWERKTGRPKKIVTAEPSSTATEIVLDEAGQIAGTRSYSRPVDPSGG